MVAPAPASDQAAVGHRLGGHGLLDQPVEELAPRPGRPAVDYETYFTQNAEELASRIPAELDVTKVYLAEYPLVGHQKPAARAALIRAWSEGCALLSYQGRGSGSQLADEVLLLSSDVPALANGTRLPLVLAVHNDAAEFDRRTRQTYQELLVGAPNGGAIAAIGATTAAHLGPGYALAQRQFAEIFRAGATTQQPVGLVHRVAKGTPTQQTEHWVLLGDPALVLQLRKALVTFTSGADSLLTGRRPRIDGVVHLPGTTEPLTDFDGNAEIEVLGNADQSGYQRTEPPQLLIPYVLPGAPIHRGQVQVRAGRFAVEFTVPPLLERDSTSAKTTLLGPGGRVAAYAWNALLDAKGGRDRVVLARGTGEDSSLAPPQIRLSLPGGATRVVSGAVLTAEIEDENGIWIAGLTRASSILLELDGGEPIDVTAAYRAAGGSDTSGTVSVPLPIRHGWDPTSPSSSTSRPKSICVCTASTAGWSSARASTTTACRAPWSAGTAWAPTAVPWRAACASTSSPRVRPARRPRSWRASSSS